MINPKKYNDQPDLKGFFPGFLFVKFVCCVFSSEEATKQTFRVAIVAIIHRGLVAITHENEKVTTKLQAFCDLY